MAKSKARSKKREELGYQVNNAFDPRDNVYVARIPELGKLPYSWGNA